MTIYKDRPFCYRCNRPKSSCVCEAITTLHTQSHFVFLMHPKEARKTKNNTGRITHASLSNSSLFVGIDFSHHNRLNALLNDPSYTPFLLYPDPKAIPITQENLELKPHTKALIVIIDSSWACSKSILKRSSNLQSIQKISFTPQKGSIYTIKRQPNLEALSTIESVKVVLEALNTQSIESIEPKLLEGFLKPFKQLITFQLKQAEAKKVRY